jgi:hypothetical protein
VIDINQVQPGVGVAKGLDPTKWTSSAAELPLNQFRPYLGHGAISGIQNRFSSNYHSLQTQFEKRWGANSLFVFNYTWSPNLTDSASDRSNAPQNTHDIAAEYGPSSLDRRHNITASYVYNLAWFKEQHGFTGHALGGWEVSGLVYYYSGTPLTVTTSNTDPGGLGLYKALYTPQSRKAAQASLFSSAPRPFLRVWQRRLPFNFVRPWPVVIDSRVTHNGAHLQPIPFSRKLKI